MSDLSDIDEFLARYASRGVVVDTNLMVLLFVGLADERLVVRHRRTQAYSVNDFRVLVEFIRRFRQMIVTPQLLAEVTNLCETGFEPRARRVLGAMCGQLSRCQEHHTPMQLMLQSELLPKIGFADASMVFAARGQYLVLTDNVRDTRHLQDAECDVLNFTRLRSMRWLPRRN